MTKKGTKKSTQPRKNRNFTWKKMSFFTQKRPPSLAKNWNFAWKNHKKMTKKGTKKTTQPRKNWSFVRKKVFFFTQKYHPSSQKTENLHEKWQKNHKKRYQKEHPAPQNLIFCMKKKFFFYSKRSPTLAKNWIFAWKNDKKLTKKLTQKSRYQLKNAEVLHEKLKIVLPMGILKKKIPTPNFTKFLNP